MARIKPIGLVECPECGFPDAEIKPTKAGLLYRYCPDCSAQYFTRTEETSERLRAKMRTVSGQQAPVSVTPAKPTKPTEPEKPARKGFSLGAL